MNYTFLCTLTNENEVEEEFKVNIMAENLISAKDQVESYLKKEWGFITMRVYKGERISSSRYWKLELEELDFPIITEEKRSK